MFAVVLVGCGAKSWDRESDPADLPPALEPDEPEADGSEGGVGRDAGDETDESGSVDHPPDVDGVCSYELGCPCGLVGELSTATSDAGHSAVLAVDLGDRTFGEDDSFVLWFSVWPPSHGTLVLQLEDAEAATRVEVDLLASADEEFDANGWNRYFVGYRSELAELTVWLGNRDGSGEPLGLRSLGKLRVVLEDQAEPASARIESLRASFGPWGDEAVLYEETFDSGNELTLEHGTLEAVEQPAGSALPAGCS